jgi:peptide/nickel transport system ATP-binding protein
MMTVADNIASSLRSSRSDTDGHPPEERPLLVVDRLKKYFAVGGLLQGGRGTVKAVDDVSFEVRRGEVLGVVGESGCGKSTTARLLMHLVRPDTGKVVFDGEAVGQSRGISLTAFRRQCQMVFQDSYTSLNPRMTIGESIAYAPHMHGASRAKAIADSETVLSDVGLNPAQYARRYPHELSGGQRQRVNIARALALDPRLLILDEAVSALDKSIQAQVLNLLIELRNSRNLTYVFISHDLNVIEFISDRVIVMYLGKIVESGPVDQVYRSPRHPYTRALLNSIPTFDPRRRTTALPISGDPPSPVNPPSGCRFRTRCAFAEPMCEREEPRLAVSADGPDDHRVACHMYDSRSQHSRAVTGQGAGAAP